VFCRSGRKVYGAGWQYDGSSPSQNKLSFGTCFVTCGIVVRLPFCTRPVCLPVLARLVLPGKKPRVKNRKKAAPASGTKVSAAAGLVALLAAAFPGRAIHVVADAAYHGPALKQLPPAVTWTCRLRANAVLYDLAPPRPPRTRGRPRRKDDRLGTPGQLAAATGWLPATVRIYRRDQDMSLADITCLWYGCLDTRTVRVILARSDAGLLALVSTDLAAGAAALIERYAGRWSIEQAFADARNVLGAGEARNRARRAVERTVPFALLIHTLIVVWYARHGHHRAGINARRHAQPWYPAKTEPAFEDMLTQLRRVPIAARISKGSAASPTPEQTKAVLAAWHAAAA
jgi:DDE superfamily endonuclease